MLETRCGGVQVRRQWWWCGAKSVSARLERACATDCDLSRDHDGRNRLISASCSIQYTVIMEDLSEKQLPNRFEKHDQLVALQETILSWKQGDVIDDSVNQQRSRDQQNVEFIVSAQDSDATAL